jgi:hypothetical protein
VCFTQDDPKDWNRESALMAVIYGGSTLTLVAIASKDASDGMLFDLGIASCKFLMKLVFPATFISS